MENIHRLRRWLDDLMFAVLPAPAFYGRSPLQYFDLLMGAFAPVSNRKMAAARRW